MVDKSKTESNETNTKTSSDELFLYGSDKDEILRRKAEEDSLKLDDPQEELSLQNIQTGSEQRQYYENDNKDETTAMVENQPLDIQIAESNIPGLSTEYDYSAIDSNADQQNYYESSSSDLNRYSRDLENDSVSDQRINNPSTRINMQERESEQASINNIIEETAVTESVKSVSVPNPNEIETIDEHVNSAPDAGNGLTVDIIEGTSALNGMFTATDANAGATLSFSISDGASIPAGFVLNNNGSYRFDPADSAYDHLNVGDSTVLTVPVTVTDEHGATDTSSIQITVKGTNDAPIAGAEVITSVDEGAAIINGQLTSTDVDADATASFSISDGATAPDGFILNTDGSYSFDPTDSAYDHLNVDDSTVLTVPVTVTDEHGATDTSSIQITVKGTNDAPIAGAEVITSVDEGAAMINGQLTSTDLDTGATVSFSISDGATAPDGFALNTDGSYSFDPADTAYDHLNVGDSSVLTIPITVTDEHGATDFSQIQITVQGTNDAPIAGAEILTSVNEGAAIINGQLTSTDVDAGAAANFSISDGTATPDGFILNVDGSYSFDPTDSAYDHLNVGDSSVLTIPVTVTDDNGATDSSQIQVTVKGTNDAPVAGAEVIASVNEGEAMINGQLTATDLDDDATAKFNVSDGATAPDGFALNTDGSYSFDPTDSAYDHLNVGDSSVLTIPVTVTDDNGATDSTQIQITVKGTNDAPVAGAVVITSVDEGAAIINGQLTLNDVDDNATASFSVSNGTTVPDGFILNTDGSYSFDPTDSAYGHLNVGDSSIVSIPVTVTDEHGATDSTQIQVTVKGTNDAPIAGAEVIASVDEGATIINGQLTSSDVDDNATASFSISDGATIPDGFVLNTDGAYSFDPADSAYDHLNVGDSIVLTVPVTVTDENGATDSTQIQVTVRGTNDAPVAGAEVITSIDEGAAIINGQLTSTDVDAGATASFSISDGAVAPAGFVLNTDGSYSFDPADSAYDHLNVGDSIVLTVPVTVTDENGATDSTQIQVTVRGTNDAPVAGAEVITSIDEGAAIINGQLTSTDVDAGATASFSISDGAVAPAGFVLNTDSSYSFDPADSAYDHLNVGDSTVLTVPVTVTDDNGATDTTQIQVTVKGTNDAPIAGAEIITSVDEGAATINGQLTSTDVDAGATASFSVSDGAVAPEGFVLNTDGSYSFNPADSAYDHLNVGDSTVLTVPITFTDEHGATDTSQIQITVKGTNDVPVAGAELIASVDEGAAVINGQLTSSDVDDNANASFSISDGATVPDGLVLNTDGAYSFDPTDSAYDHLNIGDSTVLTLPITVTDEHGATGSTQIQITVRGTNDAPVAGAEVITSVDEGSTAITGQLSATDVDTGATASFSISDGATAPDGLVLNTDGSYSFDPVDSAYDYLNIGDSTVLTIPITVTDEHGAMDSTQIQITVNGSNDAPTAIVFTGGAVDENSAAGTVVATLSTVDEDNGETFTYSLSDDPSALFEISGDQIVVKADADIDFEQAESHTVTVQVTDSAGNQFSQQVTLEVNDLSEAATDITLSASNVSEHIQNGTVVGDASAVGPNATETYQYSLADDADGRFSINAATGEVTVSDGLLIDYEQATSHQITVVATNESGETFAKDLTINVDDLTSERVTGDARDNTILSGDGNDWLYGGTGNDQINSGDGVDYIIDTAGDDVLQGGGGNDYLIDYAGDDVLQGGDGNDLLYAVGGQDRLEGGAGDDLLITDGNDVVDGGAGVDTAYFSTRTDGVEVHLDESGSATVADGNGTSTELHGIENVFGSQKQDSLAGNNQSNTLDGYNGDDVLAGNGDDDILRGGFGDDALTGGSGDDVIDGGADHDVATYSGNWSDYSISVADNGAFTITDTRDGSPDGTDTVSTVEEFQFADGTVSAENLLNVGPQDLVLDNAAVNENTTAGQLVATISVVDDNQLDAHTYALTGEESDQFELVGNQLYVKAGADLDFEASAEHSISIQVTDAAGETLEESFVINVNDVNEAPTEIVFGGNSVDENSAAGTVVATLATVDEDNGETFSYALSNDPSGLFEISGDQIVVKAGADIDFEQAESHTVTVEVTDSAGNQYSEQMTVNVNDVVENIAPTAIDDTRMTANYDLPPGGQIISTTDTTVTVTGEIISEGEALSSVDHWSFSHNGGPLTIDTLTESGDNFIDIDGDGVKDHIDTMMHLYNQDGDLVASNDDSTQGTADGSTNDYYRNIQDSYLELNDLPAGEYTLAIGSWELTEAEVAADQNDNSDQGRAYNIEQDLGPYQIAITGDVSFEHVTEITTDEDSSITLNVLANDSDADGDALTITDPGVATDIDGNVVGTTEVVKIGGLQQIQFTPGESLNAMAAGETKTVNFSYTVADGIGGTQQANVVVNVTGNNDGISAVIDSDTNANSVTENIAVGSYTGITLAATDADGDSISYAIEGDTPFTVDESGRVVTSAEIDFETTESYSLEVTATSTDGTASASTFKVAVTDLEENRELQSTLRSETLESSETNLDNVEKTKTEDLEIKGTSADDKIIGGDGNDSLTGGAGDDVMAGGKGNDKADGGEGSDTYLMGPFDGSDYFNGGEGGGWIDAIDISEVIANDPDSLWKIEVDGVQQEYDMAAGALELSPDSAGIISFGDGNELNFEGVERIEW